MRTELRSTLVGLAVVAFVAGFLILPVFADMLRPPPEYMVIYYDSYDCVVGTWYPNENHAVEDRWEYGWAFGCRFTYKNIPQDGDVYKIRIDYDGWSELWPEVLDIEYRWASGSWTDLTSCSNRAFDIKFTITDASSSTLYVSLTDSVAHPFEPRDVWEFGREPELWIYWY
ncbi:MAG: hypothetical protein ACE5IO_01840 [Thermoplasmata archaeon]